MANHCPLSPVNSISDINFKLEANYLGQKHGKSIIIKCIWFNIYKMVGQNRQFMKTQIKIESKHSRSSIFLKPNKDLISYIPYNFVKVIFHTAWSMAPDVWRSQVHGQPGYIRDCQKKQTNKKSKLIIKQS